MKYLKFILFLFLISTHSVADQNCTSENIFDLNSRFSLLEKKLDDIESYKYTFSNQLKGIETNYKDKLSSVEHSYQSNIKLYKEQYKYAKESMENRKTILTVIASIVMFFVVSMFAFYGYRIYDVHNTFKSKEDDYKKTMEEMTENITRKFENIINRKQEDLQKSLNKIEDNVNRKIDAIEKEAENTVRKLQDDIDIRLQKLESNNQEPDKEEIETDDPFTEEEKQ